MNQELCFIIENTNLYLEQVLVEYRDIPIFFLCSGDNQYYIALCTDMDELNYIVAKLSLLDVYNLLHGNIPMRDAILKQMEYWDIKSNDEIELDVVTKKKIKTLETSLLPEENACFEILTEQMQLFVEKFDRELADALPREADDQSIELIYLKIEIPSSHESLSYDEMMDSIRTAEAEQLKQPGMNGSFNLVGLLVNSLAVAA